MAQAMMGAMKPGGPGTEPAAAAPGGAPAPAGETKFCLNCGVKIPRASKFCPECGTTQA
jgi:membrane protease subunit (stomatin/prohibitin family)